MHQELTMALAQARREFLNPVEWRGNSATVTAIIMKGLTEAKPGQPRRLIGLPIYVDASLTADLILVTNPAANSITLKSLSSNRLERVSLISLDLAAMEAMRERVEMRP